jgi:protein-S-isoprenylcysteine O-methyltransferase Ste14
MNDKIKQYIGLFGGFLSAVLLFLGTLNVEFEWFTTDSIDAFIAVLIAFIPFALLIYGVYKNSYIMTGKARKQEQELKRKGLK